MNPARCDEYDYINFLVAAQKSCSCVEAGRVQPRKANAPAHDSLNRMLNRKEPTTEDLWREAKGQISKEEGLLLMDDSTLDKPYAKQINLVYRHWSGKHHRVVQGINLLTILWTDGDKYAPCDHRIYDKQNDNLTKNQHFANLLSVAYLRGFKPRYVCFDGWYSGLANLKSIQQYGWQWFTRLRSNRLVDADNSGNVAIARIAISEEGRIVHLKGYGFVKVFRTVSPNGDVEHWATSHLEMHQLDRLSVAEKTWAIENYHRGIKQFCGIEKCQARSATAQRNHIGFAIRAFLRLQVYSYATGHSWFEAKMQIIRDAIRAYLENPIYTLLGSTA
jgi:hypothetical protein